MVISCTRTGRNQLFIFCSLVVFFTRFNSENPYWRAPELGGGHLGRAPNLEGGHLFLLWYRPWGTWRAPRGAPEGAPGRAPGGHLRGAPELKSPIFALLPLITAGGTYILGRGAPENLAQIQPLDSRCPLLDSQNHSGAPLDTGAPPP